MSDDRSKLPPGLEMQWESGYPYPEIDVRFKDDDDADEATAIAAAWAFVDRIRAEERERIATSYLAAYECQVACCCTGACRPPPHEVAAWLRAGADPNDARK